MILSSLPVVIITIISSVIELNTTLKLRHVNFWINKVPECILIIIAVLCVVRVLTMNPGISELVFHARETHERRKYALDKLIAERLISGADVVKITNGTAS